MPVCLIAGVIAAGSPPLAASAKAAPEHARGATARALSTTASTAASAAGKTTVVLTFDDGTADHLKVSSMLAKRGLKGTFYVNSARLGEPGHLTVAGTRAIARAGNEIGGHTLHHLHLPAQPENVEQTEICDDRRALLGLGFTVRSFAYPFGEFDDAAKQIALRCGYTTARGVYGLRRPTGCTNCPVVEKLPPADRALVRTTSLTGMARTARNMEGFVRRAQGRGGLLIFVFHKIPVTPKDQYATSLKEFTAFLDWIAKHNKAKTIVVKTMGDAIGGRVRPIPDGM